MSWNKLTHARLAVGALVIGSTSSGSRQTVDSTIAAGSNGAVLPQATINLAGANAFAPGGGTVTISTATGPTVVTFTGQTATTLTGCTGGSGTLVTGQSVTQTAPALPATLQTIYNFRSIATALTPGAIGAAATVDTAVTVVGARVGDNVSVQPYAAIVAGFVWTAFVSAQDTVTIRISNITAGSLTPTAAGVWTINWFGLTHTNPTTTP